MDRAIVETGAMVAAGDVELTKQATESDAGPLVTYADPDRTIFVMNAHRDNRAFESGICHSGHCEKQLARQETRLINHDRDNGPQIRDGQGLRRLYAEPICRFTRREGELLMTIQVGDRLPDVPLAIGTPEGPKPITSGEFFSGKKVALFAVPGAFTPTCSARHLPSYVEKAEELKGQGIDEIACISVNDPFVMAAWGKADGSQEITMLADGNGAFADAVGLAMDGSKFGMGKRSQRYSMIVNDGLVEQLNIEAPGEYRASSAEYMLDQLATA